MRVFRLTRSKYPAFSERGSLLANARWHWAGIPMIYCADSRASAVLETLVHAQGSDSFGLCFLCSGKEIAIERIDGVLIPRMLATEPHMRVGSCITLASSSTTPSSFGSPP